MDLEDTDLRQNSMKLGIEAHVYDHRHEPVTQTDIFATCTK